MCGGRHGGVVCYDARRVVKRRRFEELEEN
jgi:hypothetical protein